MASISFVGRTSTNACAVGPRGTEVTLGNLKARIPASGNVSLQLATVSGTYSVYGTEMFNLTFTHGSHVIQQSSAVSIGTSYTYIKADDSFLSSGETSFWTIHDTASSKAWRVTAIFGDDGVTAFTKNTVCIEELL